jgi:hypothetical protein
MGEGRGTYNDRRHEAALSLLEKRVSLEGLSFFMSERKKRFLGARIGR